MFVVKKIFIRYLVLIQNINNKILIFQNEKLRIPFGCLIIRCCFLYFGNWKLCYAGKIH